MVTRSGSAATPSVAQARGAPAPHDRDDGLVELAGCQRPRLRPEVPILWRTATSIQIGDDVIVSDVTRSHVAWMTSLDGLSSRAVLEESLTIPEADARRLLRGLLAAAALEDAARVPVSVRWAAPEVRDLEHRRFSAALSTYRLLDRAHDVVARRDSARIGVHGTGPLAVEVQQALAAGGLACVADRPDLVVRTDAPHPDVPAGLELPQLAHPHLHVGIHGDRATIGPLVVPGATSCLRCRHLHRRDADPAWPLLSVQWAQALGEAPVQSVDPLLARLAADGCVLLVRAWVDLPDTHQAWANLAVDVHLPLGTTTLRECPPHPLCGCLWQGR